jgi:tetrahydromethanopterin S-methyltransferase subunit G
MDSLYSAFTNAQRATLENQQLQNELDMQPLRQKQAEAQLGALQALKAGRQLDQKIQQEEYDRATQGRASIAEGLKTLSPVDKSKSFSEQQQALTDQLATLQNLAGVAAQSNLPGEATRIQNQAQALQKQLVAAKTARDENLLSTALAAKAGGTKSWEQFVDSIPSLFPEHSQAVLAAGPSLRDPNSDVSKAILSNLEAAVIGRKEQMKLQGEADDREEGKRKAKVQEQNEAKRIGIAQQAQTLAQRKFDAEQAATDAAGGGQPPAKEGTIERRYNKNLQRGYSEVTALTGALTSLPEFSSSGIFQGEDSKGLFTAPIGVLTKRIAGVDANKYNATMGQVVRQIGLIANGGMKPDKGSLESLEKKFMFTPGEPAESRLYKMALIRQEVHAAANTDLSDAVIPEARKKDIQRSLDGLDKLIPFTTEDVQAKFGKKGGRTIKDMLKTVPAASAPKNQEEADTAAAAAFLGAKKGR